MRDLPVICSDREFASVPPLAGQTCGGESLNFERNGTEADPSPALSRIPRTLPRRSWSRVHRGRVCYGRVQVLPILRREPGPFFVELPSLDASLILRFYLSVTSTSKGSTSTRAWPGVETLESRDCTLSLSSAWSSFS